MEPETTPSATEPDPSVPAPDSELVDRGRSGHDEAEYEILDPRVVPLMRLSAAIGYFVLAALMGGAETLIFVKVGFSWIAAGFSVGFLALLLVYAVIWHPPRLYASWRYRIDDRVIEMLYGVIVHRSVVVPLSRLQHVDLKRGPLERRAGLASVVLYTAGTQDAEQVIPGLAAGTAEELRDQLVAAAERDDVI